MKAIFSALIALFRRKRDPRAEAFAEGVRIGWSGKFPDCFHPW